ncbi:ARM repeat-containing protein [Eremomyces bilateralis CBS 781.70]|uniref:ARM repeat-containing protein n=1 Tax=Eremomyces bilateralis CBS 781.70 TaxID=1392243 RepID=A0A6G1FZG3_9PEZI|nr:ARM repeat-containing protein [Eremomyces bilateralis CBS 781.70]KAF1811184.1 ARM repeat-containing protein [Eremomyces bilateralis CBS 781.70]
MSAFPPAAPPTSTSNGNSGTAAPGDPSNTFSLILQALSAIYDPRSTNETRRSASEWLETAKRDPDAPAHGFALAQDRSQPPALRYFGLTMLEHSIKYRWHYEDENGTRALQQCAVQLAEGVSAEDPSFFRNKAAQLWVEVAKRAWGDTWMDMDELLVRLWGKSVIHQGVVLSILETLCEDVFSKDDTAVEMRGGELSHACVEIITPAEALARQYPTRAVGNQLRFGEDGWLKRICDLLPTFFEQDRIKDEQILACAVKAVNTMRSTLSWVIPRAIAMTGCVGYLCTSLSSGVIELQISTVEALQAIFARSHIESDEFAEEIIGPMLTGPRADLLRKVYVWTTEQMSDLDEQKYALCKKITELLSYLGTCLERSFSRLGPNAAIAEFLSLIFDVLQNPSLMVSIPVLHLWSKILKSPSFRDSNEVRGMIGNILEICSERLVRYEFLPENTDNLTVLFLKEDMDTLPEQHAFLGNYRRYCTDVIEQIVRSTPLDASRHILSQAASLFTSIQAEQAKFDPNTFSKNSPDNLRIEAQISVVDAAMKGFIKWRNGKGADPVENENDRNGMQDLYEEWCRTLLTLKFQDPEITKRLNTLCVTISTKALPTRPGLAVAVLDHLFNLETRDISAPHQYSEAMQSLESSSATEMQRLAFVFSDHFFTLYDDLERKANHIMANQQLSDRRMQAFRTLLFMLIHRAKTLDENTKQQKLESIIEPVKAAWTNPTLTEGLSSFGSFCEMLAFGSLPDYFQSRGFRQVEDWSAKELDEEGKAIQQNINSRFQGLPLRSTKSFLTASTEKIEDGSPEHEMTCLIWSRAIPVILPNLLKLVGQSQAFNDLTNWSQLPEEMQAVIKRVLTDRFWQSGISTESRETFFAKVSSSKTTYEGFASTIRGTVRQIRESCYWIIYGFIRLKDLFYGIPELPGPLSDALFSNAHALSSHHVSVLLNMSMQLIEYCPVHLRPHFLPKVVSSLFAVLDRKIGSEWEQVTKRVSEQRADDNLADEMKDESILRQLTFNAISLAASLLDPQRNGKDSSKQSAESTNLATFVLSSPQILEPLLLFITHTLRVRDTRSCNLAIRALRNVAPRFRTPASDPVHVFLADEVLKAAITSFNEPYFVDVQKDLAMLIAQIIQIDSDGQPEQQISRQVLLSLPGLSDPHARSRVDDAVANIRAASGQGMDRKARACVLTLLEGVRGVSIHEMGKVERPAFESQKKPRSKLAEMYMSGVENQGIVRGGEANLAGVASMFGEN